MSLRIFLIVLTICFCACRSQKGNHDTQISNLLTNGNWKICQITDHFYKEKRVYGVGHIPKNSYAKAAGPFSGLTFHETEVKFNKDSSFFELNENLLPADSVFTATHDRFGRKWKIKNNVVMMSTNLKSVTNADKPILYGDLKVVAYTDSLLLLKQVIDKKGWTRTFMLDKTNW